MRLAQRLLLGSFMVIAVLVAVVTVLSGNRLRSQLTQLAVGHQTQDARLVASEWTSGVNPDSLADAVAANIAARVTLIDTSGRVAGDSDFDGEALALLDNHAARPEVVAALRDSAGWSRRVSVSTGTEQVYAAVRAPLGIARISIPTRRLDAIVRRAQRDVLVSGLVALAVALALAGLFSRSVSRPLTELRDTARALASGDLTHRPALSAPGEVGELADSIHRMAEQLGRRLDALAADDSLLAATMESLDEGILILDSKRRVIRANDTARRLFAVRDALPFSADVLPRDRGLSEAIGDALAGRDALAPVELTLGERTVAVRARTLSERRAVLTIVDLSAHRRLEAVRRDFVANVSHELKTPLTVIGGFAETLATDELPEAQRKHFAQTIHTSALRMQRIVDDLLDLSRIESGGWKPNPVMIDAGTIFDEVSASYQDSALRKGITLTAAVDPLASAVFADPTALRQVLSNLVENALRHTPNGGMVTLYSAPATGGVWIGVRDTGTGIPAEHLPRIFERFYRVDSGRARETGGTGLGLAIVRHLVEAHGGNVGAESTPPQGTTVKTFFRDRQPEAD